MPKVSVIIPSYNHEKYIGKALQSVLDQTFQDFEIIVVDDASSDGTIQVVEKIKDPRIRLIKIPQNRMAHTRNIGLSLAQGEYIAFQNSDDAWDLQKLEKQIEILENHSNIVVCFTAVQLINEKGLHLSNSWADKLFTTKNRSNIEWLQYFFEKGNCLCITSSLVRREKIEEAGRFRESLIQMGDFDLWIRLAAFGNFHIIDSPLTQMRILKKDKNLSAPTSEAKRRSVIEFSEVLSRYVEKPIVDIIPEIFGFVFDDKAKSPVTYLAGLARYAWQFETAHHIFADHLLVKLIDNSETRKEITDAYGNQIILDFFKQRGKLKTILK